MHQFFLLYYISFNMIICNLNKGKYLISLVIFLCKMLQSLQLENIGRLHINNVYHINLKNKSIKWDYKFSELTHLNLLLSFHLCKNNFHLWLDTVCSSLFHYFHHCMKLQSIFKRWLNIHHYIKWRLY